MCLSDRVGNPSRFKINYRDGDCYGDFWDVEPCLENPNIMRFNVDHLEFSGIAINYSKASLTWLRESAIEVVGQGKGKSGKSRSDILEILIARSTRELGEEVVKKRSRD